MLAPILYTCVVPLIFLYGGFAALFISWSQHLPALQLSICCHWPALGPPLTPQEQTAVWEELRSPWARKGKKVPFKENIGDAWHGSAPPIWPSLQGKLGSLLLMAVLTFSSWKHTYPLGIKDLFRLRGTLQILQYRLIFFSCCSFRENQCFIGKGWILME